jgi:hypothetical protein
MLLKNYKKRKIKNMYLIYLNESKLLYSIIRLKTIQGVKKRLSNYVKPLNYKKEIDTYHIYYINESEIFTDNERYITSMKA